MLYVYVIKGTGPFLMDKFSILHPYKSPFPQLSMNKLLSKNNNQKHWNETRNIRNIAPAPQTQLNVLSKYAPLILHNSLV